MDRKRTLQHMYLDEQDPDVARAALLAVEHTRRYSGYFDDITTHQWITGLLRTLTLAGNIDRIATLLGDPQSTVREAAAVALAQLGATSTQMASGYLAILSSDAKSYIQSHAIEQLGKLGDRRAAKPLLTLLNAKDSGVRSSARLALDSLGISKQRKRAKYIAALWSRDKDVRRNAVWELATAGDKNAIRPLLAMLGDRDWRIRSSTEGSLVELGASRKQIVSGYIAVLASKALKRDLQADLNFTRIEALERLLAVIERLGVLGDKRAIGPLVELLTFDHNGVRACVNNNLEKLGAGKEEMVRGYISALSFRVGNGRIDAAKRLGDIGDRRAIIPLLGLLKDRESDARSSAEQALTKLGAINEVIDVYLDVLRSQPRSPRYREILEYVAQEKPSRAVLPLISLIGKPQPGFERCHKDVVQAIGKIGDKTAIAPLLQLLDSRWRWVTVDSKGRQVDVKETDSEWIRNDIIGALKLLG